MDIFLTGATGFIGSHLAQSFVADGHRVRALVRPDSDASFLRQIGVECVCADLTDAASLVEAMGSSEAVYHGARPRYAFWGDRSILHRDILVGTENMLRAADWVGARRFVYMSSVFVYGRQKQLPIDETTPPLPYAMNERIRLEAEYLVRRYRHSGRLSTVVARIPMVTGPGSLPQGRIYQRVLRGRYTVYGYRDIYYHVAVVGDVVAGLKLCARDREPDRDCYIFAGDETMTLAGYLKAVAAVAGVRLTLERRPLLPFATAASALARLSAPFGVEPRLVNQVEGFRRHHLYDNSRAKRELGFQPCMDLRGGIRATLDWLFDDGFAAIKPR